MRCRLLAAMILMGAEPTPAQATEAAAREALAVVAAPHPEPRVIVDVVRVKGPHEAEDVQREARRLLWGKIVGCYKPAAAVRPKLRGDATFAFRAGADGAITRVRTVKSTLEDRDVVACWASHLRRLPLPSAARASDVVLQIHVAPGDPPDSAP